MLRYLKHEQCEKNGNDYGSYDCRPSPYGGNECVGSGGGGGGMMDCHSCLETCPDQRPPLDNPDPGHGNFGVMTLPGITNDWAKCDQPTDNGKCFTGINPYTGNKINCLSCVPDEKTECGQQLIASGLGGCAPDMYFNKCCKSSVKSMRKEQYKYMVAGATSSDKQKMWCKYIGMGLAFLLVIFLIVYLMKRPKKSQFAVYWRR